MQRTGGVYGCVATIVVKVLGNVVIGTGDERLLLLLGVLLGLFDEVPLVDEKVVDTGRTGLLVDMITGRDIVERDPVVVNCVSCSGDPVVRAVHLPQDSGQRTDPASSGSRQNNDGVAVPWDAQKGQSSSKSVQSPLAGVAVVGRSTDKVVL